MKLKQKAFTLIELMVVIAMIGFLASIILLALNQARLKARDAKRVEDMKTVQKAMELYFSENATYPQYGTADTAYNMSTAFAGATPSVAPSVMSQIPVDPLVQTNVPGATPYQYLWHNGGKDYAIAVYYEQDGHLCKYHTPNYVATWFSSAPDCTR